MADMATLKQGEGGFTCELLQMLKKYLIDLSVPNFNVTDCSNKAQEASVMKLLFDIVRFFLLSAWLYLFLFYKGKRKSRLNPICCNNNNTFTQLM